MSPETLHELTGLPTEEIHREIPRVKISRSPRVATQSGPHKGWQWRMIFMGPEKWENNLIGWTSARDPASLLRLTFSSKEEAQVYAEAHGLNYVIEDTSEEVFTEENKGKSYADNFLYKGRESKKKRYDPDE